MNNTDSAINFKIVTTDYDNQDVKKRLKDFIDSRDFYAKALLERLPNLISSWKEKDVYDNSELIADIIIIDDEIDCILQYFKTIQAFVTQQKATIKNVIACTKAGAAHLVIDKLYENASRKLVPGQQPLDPYVVFMDFDLQEQELKPMDYLTSLVNKIFSHWEKYDIDIVGVSAYAFKEHTDFSPFQQWLRDDLIYTFPKSPDLWEIDRMMIHYKNYLMRKRFITQDSIESRKQESAILADLEVKHTKWKINSTILLMDALEKSIADLEYIEEPIIVENLKVANKDGNIYSKGSLKVEVGDKKVVISDLLKNSSNISSFTNRWNRLTHQISIGNLFPRSLRHELH